VPGFDEPARWRADGTGLARLTPSEDGGLTVQLRPDGTGSWPTLLSRDTPAGIPAVIASGTATTDGGNSIHDVTSFGLDSAPVSLDGFTTAVSLPMLDRTGVLVDLDTAVLAMRAGLTSQTQYAVFASSAAPADLAARLRAHGLTVTRTSPGSRDARSRSATAGSAPRAGTAATSRSSAATGRCSCRPRPASSSRPARCSRSPTTPTPSRCAAARTVRRDPLGARARLPDR
jgi:hypothetical protein